MCQALEILAWVLAGPGINKVVLKIRAQHI